ncbi:4-phosphoerythronate dehydrogenase PdxB [Motiliproteus sediminis]|uniref:4-phosphoerythronate dehydrogenase PdxB n=1 Tax=Motiliproteus sediminis TaxID=1468178 RepID=UPI001AF0225E|nr:4-phosphoerythronate dehydrogenase PdxB [Motiliproteus sediminis]
MKIVYDQNIPYAAAFFGGLGELFPCDGRCLSAGEVKDADVLLVRSVTPVNERLLAGSRVGFVASATIGTDHVARDWLQQAGIGFANAPGCNAESVADYVVAALLQLAEGDLEVLRQRRAGVVGVGNVGTRVASRLEALGVECLRCDPPRAEREHGGFVDIDTLLDACDLVCLHTPLTSNGKHPTRHLIGKSRLAGLRHGSWLLNAGRGAVIDNAALAQVLDQRDDLRLVLDVWEPEPAVNPQLVPRVEIATPHIAGYSDEGRSRGTEMIYQALCAHLGVEPGVRLDQLQPPAPALNLSGSEQRLAWQAVRSSYAIVEDDRRFRRMVAAGELPAGFDRLRRDYPGRREFSRHQVVGCGPEHPEFGVLGALGFQLPR